MQTFLPYSDFAESAKVLDYRRLGKQRIECKQIFFALKKKNYGWNSHPAVTMWRGCEGTLCLYGKIICLEWRSRGYKDEQLPFFERNWNRLYRDACVPPWLGDEKFHASHRSNLLRKNAEFYSQYNWKEPNNLPYEWPKGYDK